MYVLRCGGEGVVEFGAEAADEGFAKELVHANTFAPATLECTAADVPAMQVESHPATFKFFHPDGIEGAGDRLAQAGFFDCAEAVIPIEATEGTFLRAGHQRRHKIAVAIHCKETRGLGGGAPFIGDQMPKGGIVLLQGRDFLLFERGATVAHYTAGTLAHGVVAGEKLTDDVLAHKDITDLHYGTEIFPSHSNWGPEFPFLLLNP